MVERDARGRFTRGNPGGPGRKRKGKNLRADEEGGYVWDAKARSEWNQIYTISLNYNLPLLCPSCNSPTEWIWRPKEKQVYVRCSKCAWNTKKPNPLDRKLTWCFNCKKRVITVMDPLKRETICTECGLVLAKGMATKMDEKSAREIVQREQARRETKTRGWLKGW